MAEHQGHSIQYRISIGFQKGKKVFALQTLPPLSDETQGLDLLGKMAGFSLHAGVSANAGQRDKLERLCRAARLKRVFNIDMNSCCACGGAVKVVACIDDPVVINKILRHIKTQDSQFMLPVNRAPPASFTA